MDQMKGRKKKIRGKMLQGTPYFISEDEKLGKGTYGQVYRAYDRMNPSKELVVKIISLLQSDNQQSIATQLQMLHQLPHHQNLVNCQKAHIASQKNLYIIMQYCNQGSLQTYIQKMTLMPQNKIWEIIVQLCKGYQVLYDSNLLHRDIKPENILIHNKMFKLADFGLSKKIKNHNLEQNLSYAGSPLYIAPEIIDKHEGNSKVDVFSLGSVLYELTYDASPPFFDKKQTYNNVTEYYEARKDRPLLTPARNKKGQTRSQELRKLIGDMLEFSPEKRISWQDIFQHPKININQISSAPVVLNRMISQQEQEMEMLKNSLQVVSHSSTDIKPIVQKPNIRTQSEQLTLELINFYEFLSPSERLALQQQMYRLKITQLTILHVNNKINYIFRQNQQERSVHRHIMSSLQRIVTQGLLYLIKINLVITARIGSFEAEVVKGVKSILEKDRRYLYEQFKKQVVEYKHKQEQIQLQSVNKYDIRRYQQELYSILTQYCDYPLEAKQKVMVVISLLLDVYDSSLKLSEMVQTERIVWQKYQDMSQIQTKMDQFCYNKLQPHQFHTYLLQKEHIDLQSNNQALKRMGLLFT